MFRAKRILQTMGIIVLPVLVTGCSGVNYTHGVSPASFLLPGLVEYKEPATGTDILEEESTSIQVTQNF